MSVRVGLKNWSRGSPIGITRLTGDREGRIFLSHPQTNNGFSCSPLDTSFLSEKHEKGFQKI